MQRGFSQLSIIVLAVVIGLSFYLGTKYKSPSLPQDSASGQAISSDTAKVRNKSILDLVKNVSSPSVAPIQAKPSPSLSPSPSTEKNSNGKKEEGSLIVSKGVFNFSDHKINYTFSFPKSGGDIKGTLEGVCSGNFVGNYNGGEENSISGSFEGICTAGPLDLIKTDLKATFNGNLNKKTNKIQIRYTMTKPASYPGYFELDFKVE